MKKNIEHRTITDYPNYEITPEGDVWSSFKQRYLSNGTPGKYTTVRLFINNKTAVSVKVHRLMRIFMPHAPTSKHEINHKDGVKSNNRLENLEWVTRKENINHAFRYGLKHPTKGKKIYQVNPITNMIMKEFDSIKLAAQFIGKDDWTFNCKLKRGDIINGFRWTTTRPSTNVHI